MRLLDAICRFLRQYQIHSCPVTVALSGGADSICLLDGLQTVSDAYALDVRAIHIQHNLRGEESLLDEQFCRAFCAEHSIPLTVVSCDVAAHAQIHRLSVETAARECRYHALEEHCPDGWIATAHTATDNLETLLQRICRGSGLRGMGGIPPVRDCYLRPLLMVSRADVEAYAHETGLLYVMDSTNQKDAYTRNFIRHHLLPPMRECNPSVEHTTAAMFPALREDADFLEQSAAQVWDACRQPDGSLKGLETMHPALQTRCIARLLREYHIPETVYHIREVQSLLQNGGSVELVRGGLRAYVSRGYLWIADPSETAERAALQMGTNRIMPSGYVEASCILREDFGKFERIHTMFANSVLDYDIIEGNAELHGRIAGLHIRPEGREHSISIKKWLNAEVPPPKRKRVHYLSDAQGLLWVEGLGTASRAAVTKRTKRMLLLRVFQAIVT